MKKLIIVLLLFLAACSGGAPTASQADQTPDRDEAPTGTPLPASEASPVPAAGTSASSTLPTGPLTLVALGDSLTQGDGDDSGRGYPGRVLEMLNTIRPDSTLINLGQSGWSSDALINGDQGLDSQLERAVSALQ